MMWQFYNVSNVPIEQLYNCVRVRQFYNVTNVAIGQLYN